MSDSITLTLAPGTVLHGEAYDYKIIKVLGQGTFGITYQAKVEMKGALGRLDSNMYVAVKEFFMKEVNGRENSSVTSGSTANGGLFQYYRDKFEREARNLSQLNHPNIVKVLEAFHANGTTYYSMEYIDGVSLDQKITCSPQGRMPLGEAVETLRQIGAAIAFMHSRKMLHLDVKPGNVMVRKDGTAVLIDFGLSKQYTSEGEPESSTKVGAGTPGYAPIEQASYHEGKGFPTMMDVYALGGTMFKMLTGQRPPEASEILNDGFPYGSLRQLGIAEHTVKSIAKAMAPLKKDRWQTVDEFVNDLCGQSESAPTDSSRNAQSSQEEHTLFDANPQNATAGMASQGNVKNNNGSVSHYNNGGASHDTPYNNVVIDDDEAEEESWFARNKVLCAVIAFVVVLGAVFCFINPPSNKNGNVNQTMSEAADSVALTTDNGSTPNEADGAVGETAATETNYDGKTEPESTAPINDSYKTNKTAQSATEQVRDEPSGKPQQASGSNVYETVEQMPSFPGGTSGLMRFLSENVHYPAVAQENGVQGRVIVSFIVEKDGRVSNASVVRLVDPSLDKEALRVVRSMPRWTPGKINGEAVRVKYNVPVNFRLE